MPEAPCQCDDGCVGFGDCCPDKIDNCGPPIPLPLDGGCPDPDPADAGPGDSDGGVLPTPPTDGACGCAGQSAAPAALVGALDLCDGTVLSSTLPSGDPLQFGSYADYWSAVAPRAGDCLAVLSTGAADTEGGLNQSFTGFVPDPDPRGPQDPVNDLAQLRLELDVPDDAAGAAFDHMFISIEWPEFLCSAYNDSFYGIVETAALNGGNPTNVASLDGEEPINVNSGLELPAYWSVPLGNSPYGAAEGFATSCTTFPIEDCALPEYCQWVDALSYEGSGTGWLTTTFPVVPGETLTITFSIHDEADSILDSSVFLDNFRWLDVAPEVSTFPAP